MNLNIIPPGWSLPPMPVDLAAAAIAQASREPDDIGGERRRCVKVPREVVAEIRRLAAERVAIKDIAARVGVSYLATYRHVRAWARESGQPLPPRPRSRLQCDEGREAIARTLIADGIAIKRFARMLGMAPETVRRIIRRNSQ